MRSKNKIVVIFLITQGWNLKYKKLIFWKCVRACCVAKKNELKPNEIFIIKKHTEMCTETESHRVTAYVDGTISQLNVQRTKVNFREAHIIHIWNKEDPSLEWRRVKYLYRTFFVPLENRVYLMYSHSISARKREVERRHSFIPQRRHSSILPEVIQMNTRMVCFGTKI